MSRVAAVIVNFNAGEALLDSLDSLEHQAEAVPTVVWDNASTDGSLQQAMARFGENPAFVFESAPDNPGFAAGVNRAVERLRSSGTAPEYLLILNPDCSLEPGALDQLTRAMDEHQSAGLAGPLVLDGEGQAMRGTLRNFPDPWNALVTFTGLHRLGLGQSVERSHDLPDEVEAADAVSGACMLVRYSLLDQLGGMDEAYLLHCEDLDLMYRLKQGGYSCLIVPAARVRHEQGRSSSSRPLWVHWQKHQGMKRFFDKFQAQQHGILVRGLVKFGIGCRFLLGLPAAVLKR